VVTIPLRTLTEYTLDVSLEGAAYKMRVKWNYRGQYYTLDFLTKEGVELVTGMKLTLNASLLRRHPGRGLPPGEIVVVDASGDNSVITIDNLENRVQLVYMTEAEYAAI